MLWFFFGAISDQGIGLFRWTSIGGQYINTGIDNVRTNQGTAISVDEPNNITLIILMSFFLLYIGKAFRQERHSK